MHPWRGWCAQLITQPQSPLRWNVAIIKWQTTAGLRQEKKKLPAWNCKGRLGKQIVTKILGIQTVLLSLHSTLLKSVNQSLIVSGLFIYNVIIQKMLLKEHTVSNT